MPKPNRPALATVAAPPTRADLTRPSDTLEGAKRLPLDLVDPNPQQARQVFDEGALAELANSIRAQGVLQPIVVRVVGDRYQIVAGERRTRAARLAGLTDIPAIIRELSDQDAAIVTALENLQREDLDIEDEARQYQTLLDVTGWSGRALAEQLGKKPDYVNRRLALMQRPYLFEKIRAGDLTVKQALAHIAALAQLAAAATTYDTEDVVTPGASTLPEDSELEPALIERPALDMEQPPTSNVQRSAPAAASSGAFRWRPWVGFKTVLEHTQPADVPAPDRAGFLTLLEEMAAQIAALRAALSED